MGCPLYRRNMLDCSGCGYATCRDKAIAVCRGLADPFMCIPHARDKAEAQSNMLFDYSPMGVVVMDMELKILELNPIAQNILSMTSREAEVTEEVPVEKAPEEAPTVETENITVEETVDTVSEETIEEVKEKTTEE